MSFSRLLNFILRTLSFNFLCRVIAVSTVILVWDSMISTRPEIDNSRKKIADTAISKISNDLRRHRGDLKQISVMHFKNDPSDYVTVNLRKKLTSAGIFDVKEAGVLERINYMAKRRNKGFYNIDLAVKHGRSEEVQAVVIGNIERFESINGGAVIKGTVLFISIPDGRIIAEIPVNESTIGAILSDIAISSSEELFGISSVPWHIRFLVFVMTVLLLPVLTIVFIRCMVAKRSNGCNAFVLGIYTTADMILAFFMSGGVSSTVSVVVFLSASILAFFYNLAIMSFALKLES